MIIITIVCSFMRRGLPAIIRCAQHVQPQMDSIIGYERRMRIIRHTTGRRRNPRVQSTKPHSFYLFTTEVIQFQLRTTCPFNAGNRLSYVTASNRNSDFIRFPSTIIIIMTPGPVTCCDTNFTSARHHPPKRGINVNLISFQQNSSCHLTSAHHRHISINNRRANNETIEQVSNPLTVCPQQQRETVNKLLLVKQCNFPSSND